jgi:thioredoxin 1
MWLSHRVFLNWRVFVMNLQKKGTVVLAKGLVVVALVLAVGFVVYAKRGASRDKPDIEEAANPLPKAEASQSSVVGKASKPAPIPRLVDLGADKCIPCKMMAPILKELKAAYAGCLEVDFIDVWKNPDAGKQYEINVIPTQIFYDASGKELFRHEGFLAKEDILTKWKELGVDLTAGK